MGTFFLVWEFLSCIVKIKSKPATTKWRRGGLRRARACARDASGGDGHGAQRQKQAKQRRRGPKPKKKTSKTKQFFLMYLSTHSLSLSLSLSLIAPPSVVVGKNLSARNAAKTLSQRKQVPESKKKNTQFAQVLGRKKKFNSLSTLSQFSLPLFQFCFLKLETDTLVGKTKENPPLSLSVSLFLPVFFFLIEGKKKRGEIIISI